MAPSTSRRKKALTPYQSQGFLTFFERAGLSSCGGTERQKGFFWYRDYQTGLLFVRLKSNGRSCQQCPIGRRISKPGFNAKIQIDVFGR